MNRVLLLYVPQRSRTEDYRRQKVKSLQVQANPRYGAAGSVEAVKRGNEIYHVCTSFYFLDRSAAGKEVKRMKKQDKRQMENLREELRAYHDAGVFLWLDGRPSTPKKIAKACFMCETSSYMRDYIQNEKNEITDIAFDIIKQQK